MNLTRSLACLAALSTFAISATALGYTGENFASQAKIDMSQATQIALHARPGTVTDRELEKEGGGSGLRYSFDVKSHGTVYEVGVDAMTGRVLENDRESAHPD